MVKPIPEGFHTLTPSMSLERCGEAIEFFKKAFGARELHRAPDPSGKKIWHADLMIGNSHLFVNDLFPEMGQKTNVTASLWLYTDHVDAQYKRAVDAGCTVRMALADMFWGDRSGTVADPWGNSWSLTQHVKDMTHEEMMKAGEEMAKAAAKHK